MAQIESGDEELQMQLGGDCYGAVVGAAFGAVQVSLPQNKKTGKAHYIRVHPFLLWCLSAGLFIMQFNCMACLILDIDLTQEWMNTIDENDENKNREVLLVTKLVMILVLQIICLRELVSGARPFVFVVNPITWKEVKRPSTDEKGCVFKWMYCLPWCLLSQIMQMCICYFVLSVCVSVILNSKNVSDVMNNGLVITFLMDLDEYFWLAMVHIFHLDRRHYDNFKFDLERIEPSEMNGIQRTWKIWLYRGRGGKVQILENLLIFGGFGLVFIRQVFVVTHAIKTSVLPLARDMCELWREMDGRATAWGIMFNIDFVDFLTFFDYKTALKETIKKNNMTDVCRDGSREQIILMKDVPRLFGSYPWQMGLALGGLFLVFIVPQVLYANFLRIINLVDPQDDTTDSDEDETYTELVQS